MNNSFINSLTISPTYLTSIFFFPSSPYPVFSQSVIRSRAAGREAAGLCKDTLGQGISPHTWDLMLNTNELALLPPTSKSKCGKTIGLLSRLITYQLLSQTSQPPTSYCLLSSICLARCKIFPILTKVNSTCLCCRWSKHLAIV